MHPALNETDHRPWPIPARRWVMRQEWRDLLFAHWPVPATDLRRLVPDGLKIDEYDGTSWVGVVPFRMAGIARRPFPPVPGTSAFPELNVRLYVTRDGKPGVWFLSLDAAHRLAVWAARRWFHLPYEYARMNCEVGSDGVRYRSERPGVVPPVRFTAAYRPTSPAFTAEPGTLEAFLAERYCMYTMSRRGTLYRGEIHHGPWSLHRAEAEIDARELLAAHGLTADGRPHLLFCAGRAGRGLAARPGQRVTALTPTHEYNGGVSHPRPSSWPPS